MVSDAFVESLVAREIEKAYRDGWRDGYSAGRTDGGSSFEYGDPDTDWERSATRSAVVPA